jgi:hypothetical protein
MPSLGGSTSSPDALVFLLSAPSCPPRGALMQIRGNYLGGSAPSFDVKVMRSAALMSVDALVLSAMAIA